MINSISTVHSAYKIYIIKKKNLLLTVKSLSPSSLKDNGKNLECRVRLLQSPAPQDVLGVPLRSLLGTEEGKVDRFWI